MGATSNEQTIQQKAEAEATNFSHGLNPWRTGGRRFAWPCSSSRLWSRRAPGITRRNMRRWYRFEW